MSYDAKKADLLKELYDSIEKLYYILARKTYKSLCCNCR